MAEMTVTEFDRYIRSLLPLEDFSRIDSSRNGLQVERKNPAIRKVAFAVDAAMDVFRKAVAVDADVLFVHHGLYWGRESTLTGTHYQRISYLLEHDLGLYAVHLPLDAHLSLGNNAVMADEIGLVEVEPFGLVKGVPIGVAGRFRAPVTVDDVVDRLFGDRYRPMAVLPFGPDAIHTAGIISGGAPLEVEQAIDQGLDLYISGDADHIAYHRCREVGINAIFGGHYATEVWGVQRMAAQLAADTGIETLFLDVPTGM